MTAMTRDFGDSGDPPDNLLSPQRFGFIKPLVVALEGNV